MTTDRKAKITEENLAESRTLLNLWRGAGHGLTQAEFGARYGIGSQAAVGFFLNGKSPISMKAAKGFAVGLGCSIADFSPRLARDAADAGAVASGGASLPTARHAILPPDIAGALKILADRISGIDSASREKLKGPWAALLIGPDSKQTLESIEEIIETAPLKKRGAPEFGARQPQQQQQRRAA